jgi:hypothetical protein
MADPASGSDWFELYNGDTQPVSLGGLFFTDDSTRPTLSPMRPLSFIGTGAGAFIQFHADSNPNSGADHVNFKLSKSGDNVYLYSPSGILITGVSFGAQATGVSQGRFPDGSGNIIIFQPLRLRRKQFSCLTCRGQRSFHHRSAARRCHRNL